VDTIVKGTFRVFHVRRESMDEQSFGRYVRQRRREMDLTQEELARRVGCAAITIRKIEAEDARPSVQIAERLAMALAIPLEDRAEFVRRARAIHPDADEALPTPPPSLEEIGSEDLTGRAIRGYALNEKIGSGGMGVVYRAVQPIVEREVAIKIILPAYANHPDFIRRFEAEAQLVARLEHPYIVPLYDYWREPGVAYLVMRLLRGGSLQQLIQEGLLPVESVARLLEQIGSALTSAHRIGVVHRDLKPANILLDEDQNAYLADFGIAKNLGNPDLSDQTQAGAVIGSPQYMSPEQIRSLSVRPQSDIYCLGVMLYEMLTGRVPFIGPTPIDYIQQHISAPMPSLAAHRPGLPASLDVVIGRATAKNPNERYADVPSMLAEFRQAVSGMISPIVTVIEEEEVVTDEFVNPYKGLRPFSEADADDFFGRETLVQQLLARLSEGGDLSRFLAVIGPSGSGKSSVVKAGLIPALRRGGLLGSESWFYVDLLPGTNPFEELEAALLRIAVNPPASLLSQLKEERGLIRAINRLLPNDPSVELVLVIDQFEELFTLLPSEEERALFLNNIVTAILDERSRLRVIITLRADFIDRPLRYIDFGELLQRRNELVLPLTPDELERAILGPARRVGLKVESGLISAILRDLGDQPGTLPMLQYALTELFDQREGNILTRQGYQKIGGVLGALGCRAEEVYGALEESDQSITRQIFLRLVTLGEGIEDTRRRVPLMELEQLQGSRESSRPRSAVSEVLEAFSKSRLLTFDNDPITRSPTVEVAHEALLREWSRLRGWLDESRAGVRLQRQLANAAHEWRRAAREESFLLTGAHLEEFDGWSQTTEVALTQDEREFLNASLDFAKREEAAHAEQQAREATLKQRVQRMLQVLVAVFLVAAIISGGLAYWANGQRQEALRQAGIGLASQAQLELEGTSPERGVLLALEALENYPYTWQAERALGQIVREFRLRYVMTGHDDTVMDIAWSPDGSRFATTGKDGTLRIWDAETRAELANISAHPAFAAGATLGTPELAWSPDGNRIATAGLDKTAKVWDVATGKEIVTFSGHGDEVWDVAWSADGKQVVSVSKAGEVKVWDAATGDERYSLPKNESPVWSAAWSPDGLQIATAGDDGTARIWNAKTGDMQSELSGHTSGIWSIAWSPDGARVATAGDDGTVRIWDAKTGEDVLSVRLAGSAWDVAWSPDGTKLAATNAAGLAQVWDVSSGKEAFALQGRTLEPFDIAWSADGKWLATTAGDGYSFKIWDALPMAPTLSGTQEGILWASWSPDGKRIATTALDRTAVIWDTQTGEQLLTLVGHTSDVQDAFWSPDGSKLVTTGWDNLAKVWDANTGEELLTFSGHVGEPVGKFNGVDALFGGGWSPDGTRVATVGGSGTVRVWDAGTGEEDYKFQASKDFGSPPYFSPDGTRLATCAIPGVLQLWDAATGKPVLGGYVNNTEDLSFGDTVDYCMSGGWSPDGTRILTSSWAGNGATIWDAKTGEIVLTYKEHSGGIGFSSWSPNGKRIATGDSNGVVKIWDAETGTTLLSFPVPVGDYLFQLDWSPDGEWLAGVGVLANVEINRVWQTTDELIAYARDCCVVRELTPEERQQFGLR
jgi:WD40 repeat protein/serine/threonine protein kinase/DNA-binding XRE family transcriptional regulator